MARTVGTSDQVMHAWANATPGAYLKNGKGSVSRNEESRTLYSYAEPIARIYERDGSRLVLVSNRSFSVTTSSHQSGARSAVGYRNCVGVDTLRGGTGEMHESNLAAFERDIAEAVGAAKRAGSRADSKMARAIDLADNANKYLAWFKLESAACLAHAPFSVEGADTADMVAHLDAARKAAAKAERERKRERMMAEAERRAAWLAGAQVSPPREGGPFLRVRPFDPATLETSMGARVPLVDAVAIFKLARSCAENNRAFAPTARPHIGDFRLDYIDSDGTIRAGCHTIAYAEASRLAAALGV